MNLNVNGHNIFLVVLVTFITSALLVPFAKKAAIHVNALDIPNERKVHTKPMPRMGGLAIFGAFLLGYMVFARTSIQMLSILIGGFIIVFVGIIDDIKPIRARTKFLFQIIAACVVVFYGNIVLDHIDMLGLNMDFAPPISYIITIFFIAAITNAINFIDGLDGLASGVSSIYFLTIAVIAFILDKKEGLDTILSLIMLGGTLGFLVYNFYPAKIFMGDSGSLFLGFTISIIALLGFKATTLTSLVIPLLILAIPIFDTLMAIFRRLLKGEKISTPDKEHIHFQLLKMKFSIPATVLIIYAIDILFASVSVFFVLGDQKLAMAIYVVLMLLLLFLVVKTDVLFQHKNKEKTDVSLNIVKKEEKIKKEIIKEDITDSLDYKEVKKEKMSILEEEGIKNTKVVETKKKNKSKKSKKARKHRKHK